jgi:fructose-1,6-bisphosphatase/inositol monophosphatase family enzyme
MNNQFVNQNLETAINIKNEKSLEHMLYSLRFFQGYSSELLNVAYGLIAKTSDCIAEDVNRRCLNFNSQNLNQSLFIAEKAKQDYVTDFDLLLNKNISEFLKTIDDIPIMSEENSDSHSIDFESTYWVLDPLDATTAYICGERDISGPMLAKVINGETQFSVMLNLKLNKLALAEKNKGAVILNFNSECDTSTHGNFYDFANANLGITRIITNPQAVPENRSASFNLACSKIENYSKKTNGSASFILEKTLPHSMAALKLGENHIQAIIHDNSTAHPKQMPWDILPVKLWVEEKKGIFSALDGSNYRLEQASPILIASNRKIADLIYEIIQK